MKQRALFALAVVTFAVCALPAQTPVPTPPAAPAVQAPPGTPPAAGQRPAVPGDVARDPANPRPNQPNFIGFERPTPPMNIPAGFTPIFNGVNLAGWHTSATNHHGHTPDFHVEQGMIVGTQRPYGSGGILLTDKKYKNFEVYMEIKPDWGCDSGFFFRSTEWGAAYQITFDYLPGGGIGGMICEGGMQGCARAGGPPAPTRGTQPAGAAGAARGGAGGRAAGAPQIVPGIPLGQTTAVGENAWHKVWKREDWNTVRIRVVGDVPHATVWINDTQINDQTDTANHAIDGMVEGPIAIQVHGGPTRWVPGGFWRWRVIAIKEL